MKKSLILVGTQWGDEGKGKIVDYFSSKFKAVCRFQGGHNAGHTIYQGKEKFVLHLIPSGIFYDHVKCFIGQGVILSLDSLLSEIDEIESKGINLEGKLRISRYCSLLLPIHAKIDQLREDHKNSIGTTRRGIGPAYEDKTARRSIKAFDLEDKDLLKKKVFDLVSYYNYQIETIFNSTTFDPGEVLKELIEKYKKASKYFGDVTDTLEDIYGDGDPILYEGAQGTLLDVDYGTYPYVTSSNTLATSVGIGSGFPKSIFSDVLGVAKAYTTRVGEGPFPTELFCDDGKKIADIGNEYGATTGRPRRCGWLDLEALKYSAKLNNLTSLCITKLDVLDDFNQIKVCIGYQVDGEQSSFKSRLLHKSKPIYKTIDGWGCSLKDAKNFNELPIEAKAFIELIEEFTKIPVSLISNGPNREDLILR
ncbi:MAG: adenylosuccinate synthase [SAR86 cluster bacterium]|jgi:adenylosuccinate synthase|uniref:Adenylosuccinate synthetase n=1 Tax=SAR86 cluster bacterium TaxID=2030880 RepID=A0A520MXQ9_9GAMM|nr:adenylosuccinate synthase [SAR86 cluster bacterium]RZO25993.1 MAG: adenylosuccinate synthase [SAR86 cluster bacterium]|tara:strand:- start:752 stop:2014 length:1263 start_codon:yes stop_codon:yes gene_type:complete